MVLPELGSGVWIGIGFGIVGISLWIVGLLVFRHFIGKLEEAEQVSER